MNEYEIFKTLKGEEPDFSCNLFIATDNSFKLEHYKRVFEVVSKTYGVDIKIETPKSIGLHVDVEEDGNSLQENSLKKAYEYKRALDEAGISMPVVADDSGLFIKALDGFPGLYTRRCAKDGEHSKLFIEKCQGLNGAERRATYESSFTFISSTWDITLSANLSRLGRISHKIGTEGNCVENVFIPEEFFNIISLGRLACGCAAYNIPFEINDVEDKTLGSEGMEFFRTAKSHWFQLISRDLSSDYGVPLMDALVSHLRNLKSRVTPLYNEYLENVNSYSMYNMYD